MKKLLLLLLFIIPSVSALQIMTPFSSCDEHGSVGFKISDNLLATLYTKDFEVFARQQGEINYKTITGEWSSPRLEKKDSVHFESDQIQFRHKAMYDLKVEYLDVNKEKQKLTTAIQCPGMIYNCELFNITIEQCYSKDGEFIAYLYLGGSVPSANPNIVKLLPEKDFDYDVRAETPFEDMNDNIAKTGGLPKYTEFTSLGSDRYLLKAPFKEKLVSLRVAYSASNMGDCPQNYKIDDNLLYDAEFCSEGVTEGITFEENQEISDFPEEKNYTPYIIIGGFILAGFILIAWVLKRK